MHLPRITARQVDVVLALLIGIAAASGISSWMVGTGWGRWLTVVHGVAGLSVVVLAPAKARGSASTGLRRRRPSRWLSLLLAVVVTATVATGILHSTGLWFGVGEWSALWTHVLAGAVAAALLGWHVVTRPSRPGVRDLDRRAALRAGAAVTIAAAAYAGQEAVTRATGLAGGSRRFTGSHEVASFEPAGLPRVSWINDRAPARTDRAGWELRVAGATLDVDALVRRCRPVVAALDCTGGWWSEQTWDAVALGELLDDRAPGAAARSIRVTSATGYQRRLPYADRDRLFLATGYGGEPLRRGHGAPVRLVVPGRRGPWWVKWVTSVELDDRPWWWQLPFPLD